MHFTVQYPLAQSDYCSRVLLPENVSRFARAAESAGFSAIGFTEHPAPSQKWIDGGGHDAFDPIVALSFCAAATERMRLMTYLLVLPYRNPLLAAKSVATLDVLSGGRAILGVGTGYLKSEFAALGVEFDERNDLFDEAIETMTGIWTTSSFSRRGRHFTALAQTALPRPVQRPTPPVWIGGNSRLSRKRAARFGSGWTPLLNDSTLANTTRTSTLATVGDLAAAIEDLRELTHEAGRDPYSIDVQVETANGVVPQDRKELAAHIDMVSSLEEAGANWLVVDTPAGDVDSAVDALQMYGEEVIAKLGDRGKDEQKNA